MTLEDKIGYQFVQPELLKQALTHKSYHNENPAQSSGHNERLELLGDAVLGLAVTDLLMNRYPDDDEGVLSKKRASLVNENVLSQLAMELDFPAQLHLGRGEKQSGGMQKPRLLASAFEAFIGAYYLDGGFEQVRQLIFKLFSRRGDDLKKHEFFTQDFKTHLQELCQDKWRYTPVYRLLSTAGPDHEREFNVEVMVGEQSLGMGQGRSKKAAEQAAACAALEKHFGTERK